MNFETLMQIAQERIDASIKRAELERQLRQASSAKSFAFPRLSFRFFRQNRQPA
jgi:hypothetical protein